LLNVGGSCEAIVVAMENSFPKEEKRICVIEQDFSGISGGRPA
jgi:hypothetical protein